MDVKTSPALGRGRFCMCFRPGANGSDRVKIVGLPGVVELIAQFARHFAFDHDAHYGIVRKPQVFTLLVDLNCAPGGVKRAGCAHGVGIAGDLDEDNAGSNDGHLGKIAYSPFIRHRYRGRTIERAPRPRRKGAMPGCKKKSLFCLISLRVATRKFNMRFGCLLR